jgi:preprotein translocase subunit SecA
MTKQTTGKTGRKRIENIEHFNFDPTSLLDDNPRQEKKPKVQSVGTIAKRDAIDSVVSIEAQIQEVISEPSLRYPFLQNVPQIVDLQSKQNVLGTQTMVSINEDMTLSVSTQGLHLIVRNIVKEKLFRKLKFFDKRKHGSYSTKTNTVCGMLIKLGNISAVEADHKWWDTMRSTVMRTHTDHRNNCIKAMRLRFRGTFT